MRFYGGKFAKEAMDKSSRSFIESRDALIWEVQESDKTCKVRIQGSNQDVIVKFPQNQATIPAWLRKGNSVRIAHRSGVRGYLYIIGQGTTIPSPISGDPFPDPGPLPDAILTGCQITETDPPIMGVLISSGTFRINEVEYNLSVADNWIMYDDTPPVLMYDDTPVIMYDGSITKYIDTAPSTTYFRYDAFVVGEDAIIDYIIGSVSQTPAKPSIPTDHLLVDDYVLVIGGITEIENKHIGMQWSTPAASSIDIDIEGEGIAYELPWDDDGTPGVPGDDPQYAECDIVFSVADQFGNPFSGSYVMKLTKNAGTGDLWSSDTGYDDSLVTQTFTGNSYTFKYRREQLVDSDVEVFTASVKIGSRTFELVGIINLGAYS